jgi:hypothetical protein
MITELSIAGRSRAAVVIPAADLTVRRPTVFALARGGLGIGTTEFVSMGLLPETASSLRVSKPAASDVISAYAHGVVVGAPVLAALSVRVARKTLLTDIAAAVALLAATTLVVLIGSVSMRHRVRRAVRTRTNTVGTLQTPAPATEGPQNPASLAPRLAHTN